MRAGAGVRLVQVVRAEERGVRVVQGRGGRDDLRYVRQCLVDDGVEAVVVIGRVVDGAHRAVGLDERVLPLDDVPVALLRLRLDVARVRVLDAVVERVLRVGLPEKRIRQLNAERKCSERHTTGSATMALAIGACRRAGAPCT